MSNRPVFWTIIIIVLLGAGILSVCFSPAANRLSTIANIVLGAVISVILAISISGHEFFKRAEKIFAQDIRYVDERAIRLRGILNKEDGITHLVVSLKETFDKFETLPKETLKADILKMHGQLGDKLKTVVSLADELCYDTSHISERFRILTTGQ